MIIIIIIIIITIIITIGRGLISIEDCVKLAIRGLEVYVHASEERLIHAARGEEIDG